MLRAAWGAMVVLLDSKDSRMRRFAWLENLRVDVLCGGRNFNLTAL